jgi:hypothetical protein
METEPPLLRPSDPIEGLKQLQHRGQRVRQRVRQSVDTVRSRVRSLGGQNKTRERAEFDESRSWYKLFERRKPARACLSAMPALDSVFTGAR